MTRVYLSLGSNLDAQTHLRAALAELRARFGAIAVSPVYRCAAVGFDGPDFLNLAIALDTDLDPATLDDWLHALEDRHGRRRDVPRFSSRTLDIDIVLYGDLVMKGAGHLELPRPELKHAFVLKPLADIAPGAREPRSGETLAALWSQHPERDRFGPPVAFDDPEAKPLAGASVAVTRPSNSAGPLKRRIAALGGVALALPGVGVRAVENPAAARAALREACGADIAIFVSPNAVRHAFALLPALRFSRATQVCAVGHATARALARRGVREPIRPVARQDSEGLLALPQLARVRRRRVVLIGAPGGRDLLAQTLRERGAMLQSIHVYQRAAPRWNRRHFQALADAREPLLTLLSSAEILAHLERGLPPPLFAKLAAGVCVTSSPRLAQAARAAGFARVHLAASAGTEDLIAATQAAIARLS